MESKIKLDCIAFKAAKNNVKKSRENLMPIEKPELTDEHVREVLEQSRKTVIAFIQYGGEVNTKNFKRIIEQIAVHSNSYFEAEDSHKEEIALYNLLGYVDLLIEEFEL